MVPGIFLITILSIFACTDGFLPANLHRVVGVAAKRNKMTMMSKRRKETKGERTYLPNYKYVINPNVNATGILTMNLKTGEVINAEATQSKKSKPSEVEVGTLELYCKAGPDKVSLGDCPFTHYVNMVLQYKKLPFELKPCAPDTKPDWLVDEFDGKMPCLVHNGEAYTESDEIVRYINYFFPKNSLTNDYLKEEIENTDGITGKIFPLLAKCIKNLNPEEDSDLIEELLDELSEVDELLQESGGPYLCGTSLTTSDCSFAPKLYHLKVALAQFKNTVIPPEFERLHKYMETVFAHPAFEASSYPPDVIVWGWNNARGTSIN